MANPAEPRENLRSFDAYVDENGQNMTDDPRDRASPSELQNNLKRDPGWQAEVARLASARRAGAMDDATDAVEAEVPAEAIQDISDPSLGSTDSPVERATSALGKDEG
jgi:hypothetical protein